jgi:uncharacterized protein YukE
MSDRYSADLPAMTAAAGRLDAASDELRAAASLLDEGVDGDLGQGVTAAVDALADGWSRRLRVVEAEQIAMTADLGAAMDAYVEAEQAAATELRRGALADDGTAGGALGGMVGEVRGGG